MLVCLYCACLFLSSHCAASKIRGAVAGIPFEQFHKYSSEIIRTGMFGKGEDGKVRDELVFRANNLVSGVMSVCEGGGLSDALVRLQTFCCYTYHPSR